MFFTLNFKNNENKNIVDEPAKIWPEVESNEIHHVKLTKWIVTPHWLQLLYSFESSLKN